MITVNGRIIYSILMFSLSMLLISVTKPITLFNKDASIKNFGLGKHETIFSLGVFTIISAILSFYLFCLIDMIFS
jgi:hypothetical protein